MGATEMKKAEGRAFQSTLNSCDSVSLALSHMFCPLSQCIQNNFYNKDLTICISDGQTLAMG